jgi:uncharacterized repeat protein (TIGR01451 family)
VANVLGGGEAAGVIEGPVAITANRSPGAKGSASQSELAHRLNAYVHETLMQMKGQTTGSQIYVSAIPVEITLLCDSGGSIHITGTLNDDYTGTVTWTFSNCKSGDDILNGNATLRTDVFDLINFVATDSTFNISILTLTSPTTNISVSGSLRDQLNIGINTETLTINMVSRDNTSSEMSMAENLILDDVYDSWFMPTTYTETITGRVFDSVHGYVDVATTATLVFNSIHQLFPNIGELLFTGATNAHIRVGVQSAVLVNVELDLDGNSVYEATATLKWMDLGGPVGADLGDTDTDGMHNSWETVNGLDPSLATDATLDPDSDGLTNHDEYLAGTDPNNVNSVPSSADLVITMTDYPDPVTVGNTLFYNIGVFNAGPAGAANVVVTDALPAGLNLLTVSPSQGTCPGTSPVTCNLGTLGVGWYATIELSVTASMSGLYDNTASVASSTAEGNSANNSATAQTSVSN